MSALYKILILSQKNVNTFKQKLKTTKSSIQNNESLKKINIPNVLNL